MKLDRVAFIWSLGWGWRTYLHNGSGTWLAWLELKNPHLWWLTHMAYELVLVVDRHFSSSPRVIPWRYLSGLRTWQLTFFKVSNSSRQKGNFKVFYDQTSKIPQKHFCNVLVNPVYCWRVLLEALSQEMRIIGGHLKDWQPNVNIAVPKLEGKTTGSGAPRSQIISGHNVLTAKLPEPAPFAPKLILLLLEILTSSSTKLRYVERPQLALVYTWWIPTGKTSFGKMSCPRSFIFWQTVDADDHQDIYTRY